MGNHVGQRAAEGQRKPAETTSLLGPVRITVRRVDHRTRQLHGRQEATVLFGLLFSGALAMFVFSTVSGDRTGLMIGGGLILITGTSLRMAVKEWRELRTEPSSDSAHRDTTPDQK